MIPKFIAKLFGCTVQKVLDSNPPKDLNKPIGATREIQRQEQMELLEQQMIWQSFQQRPQQNGWFNFNRGQVGISDFSCPAKKTGFGQYIFQSVCLDKFINDSMVVCV